MMSATELYRYFDEDGALLYVGVSINSVSRACQHRQGSHWYEKTAWIEIERFSSRKQALEAERRAIAYERPKYNVVNVPKRKKKTKPKPAKPTRELDVEPKGGAPAPTKKAWLSDRELAAQFAVSRVTVWRWAREGILPPARKLGPNTTRWSAAEIEQHQNQTLEPTP